jgi:leucyl-tRNA synthetase
MKENCGAFARQRISQVKDDVISFLEQQNRAFRFYQPDRRPVVCRCNNPVEVAVLPDQWFINYGNSEWKALVHKALDGMEILPEELRAEFNYVIDWLHEKACARKSGMGTKLPWDPEWIIESLSDSTIYMAYYTISKYIKKLGIKPGQLTDEVFDHVFLGVGKPAEVAEKADISVKVLEDMRRDFSYFYPLDSRHSGRDLVPNHLTFLIFNHTAIFPKELWPRQIVTNGSVTMQGAKMSKSFGNIIPLIEGIAQFGADPLRMGILATAELLSHDVTSSLKRLEMILEAERINATPP